MLDGAVAVDGSGADNQCCVPLFPVETTSVVLRERSMLKQLSHSSFQHSAIIYVHASQKKTPEPFLWKRILEFFDSGA